MVEKLNKSKFIKENSNNNSWPAIDAARYYLDKYYTDDDVWKVLRKKGCDDKYIEDVISYMNELFEEDEEESFGSPYGHMW